MFFCHSFYSMGYGTLSVEQLVEEAVKRGVKQLALTDILNVSGTFDFVKACRKANIRPMVGVEFRHQDRHCFTALAFDEEGFAEINRYLSRWLAETPPLPPPQLDAGIVIFPFTTQALHQKLGAHDFIGVRAQDLGRFIWASKQKPALARKAMGWQLVTFLDKAGFQLHRLLCAIRHNILLSRLEEDQHAPITEHFPPPEKIAHAFRDAPQLIRNTEALQARCHFAPNLYAPKNKKVFTQKKAEDFALLKQLIWEGFDKRYEATNTEAIARIEKELDVIAELDFEAYFLITWDIIRYARTRGYFHVGRGSGANSIVAFVLGITDVDPIEMDLYFERFINKHRTSPPDFDIDFSWDERGEIQAYIFRTHGSEHVAMMATINTYQGRGPIRELGKVFGLPKAEIDQLVHKPELGLQTQEGRWILQYGAKMTDMPNHLGVHAGGILISDRPMFYHTALTPMPMGHPVTHFDMYVAEEIGFAKFDILSQRGLGHIREAAEIILENHGIAVDVHDVQRFKTDPDVRRNIRSGNTIGCFYIESPAMRQLLGKLRCDNYLTLVAASSIIRPGVAKSGMMKAYIERFHYPDRVVYTHPNLEPLLKETYGVMVYQEDVIKVAHHFAGLDLAEADILRRAMSGKFRARSEFDRIRDSYFQNCRERGYDHAAAAEVWRQIESFSGYSFSKAHSASFAVESYQSLFLKTHYPLEFAVAVINNFGGFYRTEIYVNEARKAGGDVQAPCINRSRLKTRLIDKTVFLGFIHVQGLESKTIEKLLASRQDGPFVSLEDFCTRVPVGLEQTLLLVRIGAFRSLDPDKKKLMWDTQTHFSKKVMLAPVAGSLFSMPISAFSLPALSSYQDEDAYDAFDLLGFPLCTPFDLLQDESPRHKSVLVKEMHHHLGKQVHMLGYLVATKPLSTTRGERMCFGCFLDEESEFLDTVHFPPSLKAYPFIGTGVYALHGRVTEEFGVYALEVSKMERLVFRPDPRAEGVR